MIVSIVHDNILNDLLVLGMINEGVNEDTIPDSYDEIVAKGGNAYNKVITTPELYQDDYSEVNGILEVITSLEFVPIICSIVPELPLGLRQQIVSEKMKAQHKNYSDYEFLIMDESGIDHIDCDILITDSKKSGELFHTKTGKPFYVWNPHTIDTEELQEFLELIKNRNSVDKSQERYAETAEEMCEERYHNCGIISRNFNGEYAEFTFYIDTYDRSAGVSNCSFSVAEIEEYMSKENNCPNVGTSGHPDHNRIFQLIDTKYHNEMICVLLDSSVSIPNREIIADLEDISFEGKLYLDRLCTQGTNGRFLELEYQGNGICDWKNIKIAEFVSLGIMHTSNKFFNDNPDHILNGTNILSSNQKELFKQGKLL